MGDTSVGRMLYNIGLGRESALLEPTVDVERVNSPVKKWNIYTDKDIPQHMIDCWERCTGKKVDKNA